MKKLFLALMTIAAIALTGCDDPKKDLGGPEAPENGAAVVVSGVVVDELGDPLLGVSILIHGTTIGVTTAPNGQYTIGAKYGDVLEFSFIGYVTQSVMVTSNTINVEMVEENSSLNVVVVNH